MTSSPANDKAIRQIFVIQEMLQQGGFRIGQADGDAGPKTMDALREAVGFYREQNPTKGDLDESEKPKGENGPIPESWLDNGHAIGIVVHWSAGTNRAGASDTPHYHFMIEGDGKLVQGQHTVKDNESSQDGDYAAHTFHHNQNIIGVALCGMADAIESPFSAGPHPITKQQWGLLPHVLAQLCDHYMISVDKSHVLSHAEVQGTLGIPQKGKWDIARLPFDDSLKDATSIGNQFRSATAALLKA